MADDDLKECPSMSDIRADHPTVASHDDGLRIAALRLLQTSGFVGLRRLHCEVAGAVVIVQGHVASFYLKQMAQVVVQRLDGIRGVRNLIEVRPRECPR